MGAFVKWCFFVVCVFHQWWKNWVLGWHSPHTRCVTPLIQTERGDQLRASCPGGRGALGEGVYVWLRNSYK